MAGFWLPGFCAAGLAAAAFCVDCLEPAGLAAAGFCIGCLEPAAPWLLFTGLSVGCPAGRPGPDERGA
ncbi:hypothetical protein GCM10008096_25820 [Zhihengliuella salsuginis]|uniref:Uncharacterized protein n=1 Tax=Zhihengliuella salsuginis TaxID=578222 RepID=A0ABQ3GLQ8_9MICC|nr:hypothetical protein GCM10008096_25820 [Zhihengliuella salsuginis]